MNFLDKMERKYGRYALSHLTMYIIVTYIAGYIIALAAPIMRQYLTLEPYYILHGQIWRLVSWILIPPSSLDIFTIIMLFFYYSIGTSLERAWGDFKYNVYIFSGILMTIIGSFLLYGIVVCSQRISVADGNGIQHLLHQPLDFPWLCDQLSGYAGTAVFHYSDQNQMAGIP